MIDDSVAMTPFYLLLGKHRQQQINEDPASSLSAERTPLPQGSVAIKEVSSSLYTTAVSLCSFVIVILVRAFQSSLLQLLHTPAHVLPSTSYLCSMFVQSLLISITDSRSVVCCQGCEAAEIQHVFFMNCSYDDDETLSQ